MLLALGELGEAVGQLLLPEGERGLPVPDLVLLADDGGLRRLERLFLLGERLLARPQVGLDLVELTLEELVRLLSAPKARFGIG